MRILALDPGPFETAFVQYMPGSGLGIFGKDKNEKVLDDLYEIGDRRGVDFIPIEMIASYGMPVGREVFETCVWIGRFVEACHPVPHYFVYRRDVKHHLCNSAKAKDANVRAALIDKIGPQGTKKSPGPTYGIKADMWAALGVAVTFAEARPL